MDITDLNISVRSQYHFLEGMKALKTGNAKKLDSIIDLMGQDQKRESFIVAEGSSKLCSSVTRDQATQMDLKEAEIRQQQLLALRENMDKNHKLAEEHLIKSIEIANSISYSYGPPSIQKPTRELYAEWLLAQNRKEEAAQQFQLALKKGPGRVRVLKGMETLKQIL
ncbi:hypothetical protein QRD02_10780 [Aequorivita sp. SDUM287046]|uniref:DUF892 family protein n=1 Tax=Aequorivita aurantiaca TaxID=3053356 RepID=A0ABT8DJ74_9FLAO|nr:hypothetical protein [Aequorivita aurantiaca]MDN3724869.1 hypothetical protein [Aequorivita aurantiaca]